MTSIARPTESREDEVDCRLVDRVAAAVPLIRRHAAELVDRQGAQRSRSVAVLLLATKAFEPGKSEMVATSVPLPSPVTLTWPGKASIWPLGAKYVLTVMVLVPTASTLSVGTSTITVNTYYTPTGGQLTAVAGVIVVNGRGNNTDQATIDDSTGTNALVVGGAQAVLTTGLGSSTTINNFGNVTANKGNGSSDTVHMTSAAPLRLLSPGLDECVKAMGQPAEYWPLEHLVTPS